MKKAIAFWGAAAIATLIGVAAPALANFNQIHKVTENGKTKVFFPWNTGKHRKFYS